jgi:tetratricopeptide (TPR) repeat protein
MMKSQIAVLSLLIMVSQAVPAAMAEKATKTVPQAAATTLTFEQALQQGQKEKQAGHLAKAEELTKIALQMAEAKKDPMSIIYATNSMAGVYRWQGKLKEALSMYEKVQKLLVEQKQDNTPGMATVLDNEATIYDDLGDFEHALSVRKDAIRMYEASGPSRDLAMVYANQANNFHSLKRDEEAETAVQKAITMYDQVGLKDSGEMAIALDAEGAILKVQKKYDQAEKVQRQALGMLEKVYGANSPDVAITLANLAHTESLLNRWEEAKKLMERSVGICKQVYGPGHSKTKEAEKQLGELIAQMPNGPATTK